MTADLDLFQAAEPRTCDTCGACQASRFGGQYCDLSLMDVGEGKEACGWWYVRADNLVGEKT